MLAAVLIIMIVPVVYLKQMNECTVNEYIESRMVKFTSSAGRSGRITAGNYSGLLREFAATGKVCSVSLSHIVPRSILTADASGEIVKPAPQACGLLLSTDYAEVWEGEKPDIYVFLVYSDDSRVDVTELAESDFNENVTGLQTVTYSYLGYEACASVFVMKEEYCDICGKSLRPVEIAEGCESCRKTPVSLIISPDYLTVPRYGEAEFAVVVCFRDGHLELAESWESDIDTSILGEHTVTIGYEGLIANAVINVIEEASGENDVPDEPENPGEGSGDGNGDGSGGGSDSGGNSGDSGGSAEGEFSGEAGNDISKDANEKGAGVLSDYSDCIYSAQILDKLFSEGEYITDSGYLSIRVSFPNDENSTPKTFGGRM